MLWDRTGERKAAETHVTAPWEAWTWGPAPSVSVFTFMPLRRTPRRLMFDLLTWLTGRWLSRPLRRPTDFTDGQLFCKSQERDTKKEKARLCSYGAEQGLFTAEFGVWLWHRNTLLVYSDRLTHASLRAFSVLPVLHGFCRFLTSLFLYL